MPFPLERYELDDDHEDSVKISRPVKKPEAREAVKEQDSAALFRKAVSLFKKEQFLGCVNILDEYLVHHEKDLPALKIMGFALIETGKYLEARRYFSRAQAINRNDIETLNALAYLDLSQGDINSGINNLLDALYIDKENEKIKANLEMLKGNKDPKIIFSLTKAREFLIIRLPELPWMDEFAERFFAWLKTPSFRLILFIAGGGLLALFLTLAWPGMRNWLENYRYTRGFGPGQYQNISIQDIDNLVEQRKNYKIKLDPDDIERKFALIKQNLEMGKRNRAVLLINEILHSNAPEQMKEHTLIFQSFVPDGSPTTIDYNPHYRDVVKAPFLYKDVFIKWQGTIANLEHKGKEETSFDLLINFVNDAVVEGMAQPHFPGDIKIRAGEKVTVFGTIAGITLDNKVIIKGQQIVPIGK